MAPPRSDPDILIYTVGRGFRTDEEQDLAERAAALHSDPDIRTLCQSILDSANSYLTLVNSPTTGRGYAAQRAIPSDLDICFYSGTIKKRDPASCSNHFIDLGIVSCSHLVVDGQPSPESPIRPGSMQMVNHAARMSYTHRPRPISLPALMARTALPDMWSLQMASGYGSLGRLELFKKESNSPWTMAAHSGQLDFLARPHLGQMLL